jgi:hypothetical protein
MCNTVHLKKYKDSDSFMRLERQKQRERKHAQSTTQKKTQSVADQDIAPLPSPHVLHNSVAGDKR